jgi:hypothetical protein
VIVSDWDLLRAAFDEGALHVDNSVDQIAAAVRRVAVDGEALRAGARRLRERKLERWTQTKSAIAERVRSSPGGVSVGADQIKKVLSP